MDSTVTYWIDRLKAGDEDAARHVWERYFERLVRVARRRLGGSPSRMQDGEDVAVSVFETLYRGAVAGRFATLQGRDELWKLLLRITQQKTVDLIRHETRLKRGGGVVRGQSALAAADQERLDAIEADDPDPQFLAMMEEECQRLLGRLRDAAVRRVAVLRMQGYATAEIAEELGTSLRSVERKLNLIRKTWADEIVPDAEAER